jgi:hypothetical protein
MLRQLLLLVVAVEVSALQAQALVAVVVRAVYASHQ